MLSRGPFQSQTLCDSNVRKYSMGVIQVMAFIVYYLFHNTTSLLAVKNGPWSLCELKKMEEPIQPVPQFFSILGD